MREWQKFLLAAVLVWGTLIGYSVVSSVTDCNDREETRNEDTPYRYEYGFITGCHAVWVTPNEWMI